MMGITVPTKVHCYPWIQDVVFIDNNDLKDMGILEFMDLLKTYNVVPGDLRMCWRYAGSGSRVKNKTVWYFLDSHYNIWGYGYSERNALESFVDTLFSTKKLPKAKSYNELIMKLKLGWRK